MNYFNVPLQLQKIPKFNDLQSISKWEQDISDFLNPHYRIFTPYENYFTYRGNLFQMLRQLLPEYFHKIYDVVLEQGCRFGFHTLLLRPYAKKQIGIDIPGKYGDYVADGFPSSPAMADFLVNKCFKGNVAFHEAFPSEMPFIENDSVDFIFSWCLLEHIPDLFLVAGEWKRILKTGGIMLHVVPTVMDAVIHLLLSNIVEKNKSIDIFKLFIKKDIPGRLLSPGCHSEFVSTYSEQIDIYSANNYAEPFLRNGFELLTLKPIREQESAMIFRKIG